MNKIQQYLYTHQDSLSFLLIIFCSGLLCGILLLNYFNEAEISKLSIYLTTLPSANIDKQSFFASQVFINSIFLIAIVFLGFALFAIPLIAFIMFTKGIQIGFSCAMYYYMYEINGILSIVLTLIPQVILDLIAFAIVASVAIETSILLINSTLQNEAFPYSHIFNKVLTDLLIGLILLLVSNFIKSTILIQTSTLFM